MYPPLSPEPSVVFAKEQPARSEVQAVAGASATLSCEVAQAQTEVTWYKDGKKLSSSSKVRVEATGRGRRLVVQQAGKADAGEYSCEAGGQKVSFRLDVTGQSWRRVLNWPVQVMRATCLTGHVCAYLELLSLHISPSSMFHTDTHVGLGGMTGEGVPGEGELSLSVCLHSVRLGCSVLAYALSLPVVPSVQTRLSLIIWD